MYRLATYKVTIIQQVSVVEQTDSSVTWLETQNFKVSKGQKIRNRYNQVPHLAQDTNGKVTSSQLDTTNESKEVSSFLAGEHRVHINRRAKI